MKVEIVIGYTVTDRSGNYVPALDGYRSGADQDLRTVVVDTDEDADAATWAEAVFVATNAPRPATLTPLQAAVRRVLDGLMWGWRALSVGDTVQVGDTTLECAVAGWFPVEEHDCLRVDDLEFVADYGAPGVGQSWRCRGCGGTWAKVGDRFHRPQDGVHLLRPEDVI